MTDLTHLRTLAEKAHPGPWTAGREEEGLKGDPQDPWVVSGWSFWLKIASNDDEADAKYIAAVSPDVLLSLLDRLERAEGR